MVILEAAAAGVLVMAARVARYSQVLIQDGTTGALFDPHNLNR